MSSKCLKGLSNPMQATSIQKKLPELWDDSTIRHRGPDGVYEYMQHSPNDKVIIRFIKMNKKYYWLNHPSFSWMDSIDVDFEFGTYRLLNDNEDEIKQTQ